MQRTVRMMAKDSVESDMIQGFCYSDQDIVVVRVLPVSSARLAERVEAHSFWGKHEVGADVGRSQRGQSAAQGVPRYLDKKS